MSFTVSDGAIPATVERFLVDVLGLRVERPAGWRRAYLILARQDAVNAIGVHRSADVERVVVTFHWPHDRDPSLHEAIEAAMPGRRG